MEGPSFGGVWGGFLNRFASFNQHGYFIIQHFYKATLGPLLSYLLSRREETVQHRCIKPHHFHFLHGILLIKCLPRMILLSKKSHRS